MGNVRVTWVLLVINLLLYIATLLVGGVLEGTAACQLQRGGFVIPLDGFTCALRTLGWKDNVLIYDQQQYWRLLTPIFLHGGIGHLLMNGFTLYIVGPDVERLFGAGRFLALYLLAGLTGSLMSYGMSVSPSVGASGAIFGLFGALIIFFIKARGILGDYSIRQLQGLGVLLLINLGVGVLGTGIDNWGHLGGLLGGMVAAWFLLPRLSVERVVLASGGTRGRITRDYPPLDWVAAAAQLVVLAVLAVTITPPLP